jgi:Family of unknown function (DUF5675)
MLLNLTRRPPQGQCIFGDLTVDGTNYCYTLEREGVQIPQGEYPIEVTWSPRFNRPLPLLDSVPGREDIRIHAGNWPRDTEGCILVGLGIGDNMITQSRAALNPLVDQIQEALDSGDSVTISVSDAA